MPKQNPRSMITLSAVLLAMLPALAQKTDRADLMFEAAAKKERVDGDLKAAVDQYRKIAMQYAKQPEIAARALFQLGQCQEKMGQAEARKSYEQIVREYAGAQQYAVAARARLAVIGGDATVAQQAMRAVWTGPKVSVEASLSSDGRFMTFPDWDTGNLGLHDLATGVDRLLMKTGTSGKGELQAFAEVSAISRDGKQVAYAWYTEKLGRYEIWILNLNGDQNPRRVFGNAKVGYLEPRDWSPDGKWIFACLWEDNPTQHLPTQQLAVIGSQDGSLRVLKSGPSNNDVFCNGGFSPDGKFIAYTQKDHGVNRSYIISSDGKTDVPVVPGTSSAESPVWTPDGTRIVFVSDRSGSHGLWSVRVVGGKPVGEPELLKADFSNTNGLIAFARDGSLFYSTHLNLTDIYVAGLDPATGKLTSEPKRVNQRAVGNSAGRVAWLPEGKGLSFWNRAPIGAVVVHTFETKEEREIMGGKLARKATGYGGWYPDGTLMRFERSSSDDKAVIIHREDSRTGESRASWTVSLPPEATWIVSPDLTSIYWQNDPPACGDACEHVVHARDIATGRDREVTRINAKHLRLASMSGDGRYIAFRVTRAPTQSIVVAPTAGGAARELYRVVDENVTLTGTAWTRDGSHLLVFCRPAKGPGEVWSFPTNGGSPEKSPLPIAPSEQPVVSPDGSKVAFVGGVRKSEIWVMGGLFANASMAQTGR